MDYPSLEYGYRRIRHIRHSVMNQLLTPKGKAIIRPAVAEDAPRLRALRIEALADRPEAFAADHATAVAESIEAWVERIQRNTNDDSGVICIAGAGEQLVGMTGCGRGHWPKTRHSAIIWGVYVNPEWRGLHVAEALIEECIDWGRAQGVVTVKLAVVTTNTAAVRCYARCGFSVYGVEPKAIWYNDMYYDELLMVKPV
jgi:RimJ/RimL family protein N-acetyltransferase